MLSLMPSISFQPTVEDVIAASRLHFGASFKTRRMLRAYLLGGAISAAAGIGIAWVLDSSMVLTALAGSACWFVFLSVVLLAGYLRVPGQARRTFAQQKSLQGNFTVEWSDAGISTTSERGRSRFEWGDFIAIVEGRDVILLRQTDLLFNFLPKRVLSDEQVASIMRHRPAASLI
jgi:hypothetical protein